MSVKKPFVNTQNFPTTDKYRCRQEDKITEPVRKLQSGNPIKLPSH